VNYPFSLPVVFFGFAALTSSLLADGKDYHDQDLKGKSFVGAALRGADFSDAILRNCDFSKADIRGANFKGADARATLAGADATGADFREATLGSYAEATDFSEANFEGCEMKGLGLFMAKFRGANLKKTKGWGNLSHCDLSNADIRGANFRGMWITEGDVPRLRGAIYDEDTSWPDNFDFKAAGAILSKETKPATENSADAPKKKSPAAP